MRWLALFLAASFVAAGCWNLAPPSGDSSTGDGGTQCNQPDCQSCTNCALGGPCNALSEACNANSDCLAIDECFLTSACGGDTTCQQSCEANNPNGASDHEALWSCVQCQQCSTACGYCSM
jgi:hypothetical protein